MFTGNRHRPTISIDSRESRTSFAELLRQAPEFCTDVRRLPAGDYLVADSVIVERKTLTDFAGCVVDGRLFQQASRLTRLPWHPVVMVEGVPSLSGPRLHRHALKGAMLSLAITWRIPVMFSQSPEESRLLFRWIAQQAEAPAVPDLPRAGYKPRRLNFRKVYVLQGLPGVGPTLARRLLGRFGSIRNIMLADIEELAEVPGIGPRKAAAIDHALR